MRELLGLTAGVALVALVAQTWGCGSNVNVVGGAGGAASANVATTTPASSSVSSPGDAGPGPGPMSSSSSGVPQCLDVAGPVLAVDQLFLGDTDTAGMKSPNAWQLYGGNVDNLVSTAMSTDVCKLHMGANAKVKDDGPNGLDNSFGKNVIPIFAALAPSVSGPVNDAIAKGNFTLLFQFHGLSGSDMAPLITDYAVGAPLMPAPKWDGSDCWPTDALTPQIVFKTSAIAGNQWTSDPKGQGIPVLPVAMIFGGYRFTMKVHAARLSVVLSGDHQLGKQGIISGVLDREELIADMKKVLGALNKSLCSGGAIDAIAEQLRQASDIMVDGSQDPAQECTGISIGLGFSLKATGLASPAPATPSPDPCK